MSQDDLFSVGAPNGFRNKIRYTIKVVGGKQVGVRSAGRPMIRPTVGGCMTLSTPGGMVVTQPNVPQSFPSQGPWMLAHDACSAPAAFPYSERPMTGSCGCKCGGGGGCGGGCDCSTGSDEGNLGYLGEHDQHMATRPIASSYDQPPRPGCGCTTGGVLRGTTAAKIVRPNHVPTVGACNQVPMLVNSSLPVPQTFVMQDRWTVPPVPASPACSPCARASGPATLVFNPWGMF